MVMPSALPPSPVPSNSSVPPLLTPIHQILSTRFALAFNRLADLRHQPYGTAYDHCLCERHVMEICTTLNIQRGGTEGSTIIDDVRITRDDVADWLGIPHNTFSGMITEFKNARMAHRLLRVQSLSLLPPAHLEFKTVLDAMLGVPILEAPRIGSQATVAAQEAASMRIGRFNKRVRDIMVHYSPEAQYDH